MSIVAIARMTFQEARRRRLVLAVSITGIVFLVLFAIGFFNVVRHSTFDRVGERPEVMNFFLLIGFYVVNFLVVMLTVLASVDTIAGDIASGVVQTVVTKPLHRRDVVLGKWLGLALMLTVFVLVMSGAMVAIVWAIGHYVPPSPLQGMALMVVEGLVVLTVSILGGTRLTTLANGVVTFMLYGLAFSAGWIEQIASFVKNETLLNVGIVVSLIFPSEVLWRRAAYLMQPPFLRQLGFGPFASISAPSEATVVYAVLYMAVALFLAVKFFGKRDL